MDVGPFNSIRCYILTVFFEMISNFLIRCVILIVLFFPLDMIGIIHESSLMSLDIRILMERDNIQKGSNKKVKLLR